MDIPRLLLGVACQILSIYAWELDKVDTEYIFATYQSTIRIFGEGFYYPKYHSLEVLYCSTPCDKVDLISDKEIQCVFYPGTQSEDSLCDLTVKMSSSPDDMTEDMQPNAQFVQGVRLGNFLPEVLYYDTPMQLYIGFGGRHVSQFPPNVVITLGGQPCEILATAGGAVTLLVTPKESVDALFIKIVTIIDNTEYMIASGELRQISILHRVEGAAEILNTVPQVLYSHSKLPPSFEIKGTFPSSVKRATIKASTNINLKAFEIVPHEVYQFSIYNMPSVTGKMTIALYDANDVIVASTVIMFAQELASPSIPYPTACMTGAVCAVRVYNTLGNSVPFAVRANTIPVQLATILETHLDYVDFQFQPGDNLGPVTIDLLSMQDITTLPVATLCDINLVLPVEEPIVLSIYPPQLTTTGFEDVALYGLNQAKNGQKMDIAFHGALESIVVTGDVVSDGVTRIELQLTKDCFMQSVCKPGDYNIIIGNQTESALAVELVANDLPGVRYYVEMTGQKDVNDMIAWADAICDLLFCDLADLIGGTILHGPDVTAMTVIIPEESIWGMTLDDAMERLNHEIETDENLRSQFTLTGQKDTYGAYTVSYCPSYAEHRHFCDREDPRTYQGTIDTIDTSVPYRKQEPLPFWAVLSISLVSVFVLSSFIVAGIAYVKWRGHRRKMRTHRMQLLAPLMSDPDQSINC